jgi:hypothetical protein
LQFWYRHIRRCGITFGKWHIVKRTRIEKEKEKYSGMCINIGEMEGKKGYKKVTFLLVLGKKGGS